MARSDRLQRGDPGRRCRATGGGSSFARRHALSAAVTLLLGLRGILRRHYERNVIPSARRLDIAHDAEVSQNLIRVRPLIDRDADRASAEVGSEGGTLAIVDRTGQRDRA